MINEYRKTIDETYKNLIESKKSEIISAFEYIKNNNTRDTGDLIRYGYESIEIPYGTASIDIGHGTDRKNMEISYKGKIYSINMNSFHISFDKQNISPTNYKNIELFFDLIDSINRRKNINIKYLKNKRNNLKIFVEIDNQTYELNKEEMKYIIGE